MMRHGEDVEIRTPLYGDTDFSQESRLQTNPIILWQKTLACVYLSTRVLKDYTHIHTPTLFPPIRFAVYSEGLIQACFMNV